MNKSSSDPRVNKKELRPRQQARTMTSSEYTGLFWCGCSSVDLLVLLKDKGFISVEGENTKQEQPRKTEPLRHPRRGRRWRSVHGILSETVDELRSTSRRNQ